MAKSHLSGNDQEKLKELCSFTYKEQAVWFLNAFWPEYQGEAENVWNYLHRYEELDLAKGKAGNELDELNAHRFLEHFRQTLTVKEMRDRLRDSKCIGPNDRPRGVPLVHFLMFKYNIDWHQLVNRSQGDNQEKVNEAQRQLDLVTAAFVEAKRCADDAREKEKAALAAEAPFKKAQEELEAALAELKAQEDSYNKKTEELRRKSEEGGVVSRNKAANELAQHLCEDPLPLRKAKITVEAAHKRAEKAREPFLIAREAAEKARAAADAAMEEAAARVREAEEFLEEVKKLPGQPYGALWFIDRELHEQKKYLPVSKGGIRN